jgi:hypothetical protein
MQHTSSGKRHQGTSCNVHEPATILSLPLPLLGGCLKRVCGKKKRKHV